MEILENARKEYIFTATISTMTSRESTEHVLANDTKLDELYCQGPTGLLRV